MLKAGANDVTCNNTNRNLNCISKSVKKNLATIPHSYNLEQTNEVNEVLDTVGLYGMTITVKHIYSIY